MRTLLLLALGLSTGALAIAKGGTLYIRSNDTLLLKEPKAKAATLMKLAQGTAVVWNGASEKDKQWHEVMVAGKKGFVRMTELSPNKPQQELDTPVGKSINPQSFADSGATVTDRNWTGTRQYNDPKDAQAAAELLYVEELNRAKATPEALSAKDKELRGP